MKYYVYTLARPDGNIFYVGKGTGKRIAEHERQARRGVNSHKCYIIRKIWENGGKVVRAIVYRTDNEQEAYDYEARLIADIGRDNLCNLTDGGDGSDGRTLTPEQLERHSRVHKEKWTPELRQQLRESQLARWTPEERQAESDRKRRMYAERPELREKIAASKRGKPSPLKKERPIVTEEMKAARKAAKRERQIIAQRKHYENMTEEQRAEYKRARQEMHARPEVKEKIKAVRSDPEYRARMSEACKASWANRRRQVKGAQSYEQLSIFS